MTEQDLYGSLRRIYGLMGLFGAIGFVSYSWIEGPKPALGFALGAVGSFGNFWLFVWLTRAIAPGDYTRKGWKASLFVARYAVLLLLGYVIVKALNVNGLAVVLGLLVSTVAVLASLPFEIIERLVKNRSSH
jgi:ATP synthase I chain